MYLEALDLMPHVVAILTNIAQVHIKLDDLDMAREFCDRALFLDEGNIKAFSRRALCARKVGDFASAVNDLKSALEVEPHNKSLLKEFKKTTTEWEEAKAEARVAEMSGQEIKEDKAAKVELDASSGSGAAAEAEVRDPKAPAPVDKPHVPAPSKEVAPSTNTVGKDIPTEFMLLSRAKEVWTAYLGLAAGKKEDRASANLTAQAIVPLLLQSDDCRIFVRRSGLTKVMTQFLVDAYPTAPAVSSRKDGNELAEKAGGETGGKKKQIKPLQIRRSWQRQQHLPNLHGQKSLQQ